MSQQKTRNRNGLREPTRHERTEETLNYTMLFLLMGSVILILKERVPLDDTIGGAKLFLLASVAGIGLSVMLKRFMSRILLSDGLPKSMLGFPFFIGGLALALLTPALASMINRGWPSHQAQIDTYSVLKKQVMIGMGATPYSGYLFFFFKDNLTGNNSYERIEVRAALYNQVAVGDSVRVTTQRGFFGFPVIYKMEKVQAGISNEGKDR